MKKQIEEMAKIIYKAKIDLAEYCKSYAVCMANCKYHGKDCNGYAIAEALYNAGYRKVDETAKMKFYKEAYEQGKFDANAEIAVGEKVVVDKREYEDLKLYNDKLSQGIYYGNGEQFSYRIINTRKETAREILQLVKMYEACTEGWNYFGWLRKDIAEKYGVEVE